MPDYTKHTHDIMPYWERHHNQPTEDSLCVITLHWMTGTAESMSFILDDINIPIREIALQGSHPSGYPEGGHSWFERELDFYEVLSDAEQEPLIRKETDKIAKLISALAEQYTGKIAVTGMSQGGDLSLHLAGYHPDKIHLALPMAGRLSEPMRPEIVKADNLPKVVMLQGADDHIVSVDSARAVETWLNKQNYQTELHIYEGVGHDISPEMIAKIHEELANL